MTKLQKIKYLVGKAMRDHQNLRNHKNRTKLFLWLVQQNPDQIISFESVVRSQRKLWSMNLYLPDKKEDKVNWLKVRREGQNEFKEFVLS